MSDNQTEPSIVITGIGPFTPMGVGVETYWDALSNYRSGIRPISMLSHSAAPKNIGGEIPDFDDKTAKKLYLQSLKKTVKLMCREIQFGVSSALLAVEQSGLDLETIDHTRLGVEFGANLMLSPPDVLKDSCWSCVDEEHHFEYEKWGETGLPNLEPLWLLKYLPNMPACHIGIACDARGPNNSLTLDDASGNLALGEAFRILSRGHADIMIGGSTGTRLHPVKTMHSLMWDGLADYDDLPETWARPFDLTRRGQVIAEGACSFLLETKDHAEGRGAKIWGEILGSGASCVLGRDGVPDYKAALVIAMKAALRDAKLEPGDIGHINAHGLGTTDVDKAEAAAIAEVFGDLASQVPVTALKSYLGNSGSGAGTLELAGSLIALDNGVIPATLNYTTPDPDCPLNIVRGEHLATDNKVVLNVNVTRMGQASAIIVRGS